MRKTIVRDPTNVRRKPKSARRARRSDGSSWDAGCVFVLEIISAKAPNEPVEKVTFLKTASSAGSKIENYFLSSKVFTILSAMSIFS
jgi:hypothetical protein